MNADRNSLILSLSPPSIPGSESSIVQDRTQHSEKMSSIMNTPRQHTHPTLTLTLFLVLCIGIGAAPGQCGPSSLTTFYTGGNGCSGNFFDVMAVNTVTVCSFDVNTDPGFTDTFNIWAVTGGGSYVPVSGTPAAWTLLGTATVTANAATNAPTPLSLNLGYQIPAGTVQGFLVHNTSATRINYTNGTAVGNPIATNADMVIQEGNYTCTTGAGFPSLTSAVRMWNGTIHYSTYNILDITQSAPGVGDITVSLTSISPTAYDGYILISSNTAMPAGTGPVLGMFPDSLTFTILSYPYQAGNPFHFHATDPGVFPSIPFYAGPGAVSNLAGQTIDFAALFIDGNGFYDSASNVARVAFQ